MADVQIAVIDQQDTQITLAVPGVQGAGVPDGGTSGQILAKASGDDFDTTWISPGGVSDGDKGDITVSSFGATWTIDSGVVSTTKLGGDITTAGKALLDDADAAAQRTTLGLGTLATQNGTFSGTSSGTNTGDQTIALTGDVTGSGTGTFAATIANDAVTYAKIQNVSATDKLLGRSSAGAGDVEEIACTAAGRALLDDADASAQRTTLGLVIGTDVQAYDADTAKYDDATANFTGTLQNGGSNVVVDTDIGSTVQAYDADTAKTDAVQSFTAAQRGSVVTLTPGATVTPDFAAGNNFSLALDQNTTIANPSNLTAGQSGSISITQDSTARTVAWGSYWYFDGGVPTFGTTTGAISTAVYYVDSSTHITVRLISEPTNV